MKKVVQSKMAAVLIFNHVCWFWTFFPSEPLLTKWLPWQATTLFTVYCKLFHMMPYIIILKSQKVSSAYCKPFQHRNEKPVAPPPLPSLNRVNINASRPQIFLRVPLLVCNKVLSQILEKIWMDYIPWYSLCRLLSSAFCEQVIKKPYLQLSVLRKNSENIKKRSNTVYWNR